MKKRLIALTTAILIMISILPTSVFAYGGDYNIQSLQTYAADQHQASDYQKLVKLVDAANKAIERLVKIAQMTPYDDVDWLTFQVGLIASGVMAYADSIGATVVCEYTEYVVDGQIVYIDPLRVIDI